MTVGAFEAKTKFSELLKRVSDGAEITITKHEKPVAKLVPFEKPSHVELATLFQQMEDFRAKHPLNPTDSFRVQKLSVHYSIVLEQALPLLVISER